MKHLIIIGPQMSGKTLLGNWIDANTSMKQVQVFDELTKQMVLKLTSQIPERKPYQEYLTRVFITNEDISYLDVDKEKFLIIKLQSSL